MVWSGEAERDGGHGEEGERRRIKGGNGGREGSVSRSKEMKMIIIKLLAIILVI